MKKYCHRPAVAKLPWTHNIMLIEKIKDKLTVEYSLKGVDKPKGVSYYEISKYLPKNILENLPTEEDINFYIALEENGDINE